MSRLAQRRTSLRGILTGLVLMAAALALLQIDLRGSEGPTLRALLATAVNPMKQTVGQAGQSLRQTWLDYVALTEVQAHNRLLKAELKALQTEAAESTDLRAENFRLRRLLDLGERRKDLRLRAARVVTRATNPYFRVVQIELAIESDAEIAIGMPVIATGGIVGQIHAVDGGLAQVLLVTDPRSAIDIVLEQSRARGIAVGTGEPDRYAAHLRYLQRDIRAIEGERVLTTGDDKRYPRGLVVGKVRRYDTQDSGPFQKAEVLPMVDLNALEEVFIVLGPSGVAYEDLPEEPVDTFDGEELLP